MKKLFLSLFILSSLYAWAKPSDVIGFGSYAKWLMTIEAVEKSYGDKWVNVENIRKNTNLKPVYRLPLNDPYVVCADYIFSSGVLAKGIVYYYLPASSILIDMVRMYGPYDVYLEEPWSGSYIKPSVIKRWIWKFPSTVLVLNDNIAEATFMKDHQNRLNNTSYTDGDVKLDFPTGIFVEYISFAYPNNTNWDLN
ncbi:hypothetical protein MASR2M78_30400 [Treponema sp.]